jgi:hypothetical protein
MRDAIAALYQRNRQQGFASWCGREYDFVCPSTGTYPFQWFWDSCFHAVVLSHFDLDRAKSEVTSLLANQADDGFVAHVTFWQRERYEALLSTYSIAYRTPYLSDCMQPPVLAEAVQAIFARSGDREFLREILPRVRAFFDWCDRVRDPDRDGLIAVLQADETGPTWRRSSMRTSASRARIRSCTTSARDGIGSRRPTPRCTAIRRRCSSSTCSSWKTSWSTRSTHTTSRCWASC